MNIERLQLAELEEWVDFCGQNFSVGSDYFRRHFEADPHRDISSIFIVRDNRTLVSSVRVFHREVWLGGRVVKMGGIGEVSTAPSHRGRGLSRQLLETAVAYMEGQGFVISLLSTGYFSHYARHGFRQVNAWRKILSADPRTVAGCFRELGEKDYVAMSALYDRFTSAYALSLVRSPAYWQSWCREEMRHPIGLFRGEELVGYICADKGRVLEIIGNREDHDLLLDAAADGVQTLDVPGIVQTARPILESRIEDYNMIRLLRPLTIDGRIFTDTEELSTYLNDHGGITHWAQDGF